MVVRGFIYGVLLFSACVCAQAQDDSAPDPAAAPDPSAQTTTTQNTPAQSPPVLPAPSVSEKWHFFLSETLTPMILVSAVPDATISQLMRFAPLYGRRFWRKAAFPKRLGANVGDQVSGDFFSDFVLASAFHEDTRYVPKGPSHGMWSRIGYAISRAVVTRTDSGDATFNWARVVGGAMSAALSNEYYPAMSRTASIGAVNWGTGVAGAGFSNLMPEFGPDVGHWMKKHLLHRQP
jgi:hypothetical protein